MKKKSFYCLLFLAFLLLIVYFILKNFGLIPEKAYDAQYFGIDVIKSEIDYNQNGIDDYTDILNGAREAGLKNPTYHSAYYSGGYPPEGEGVCTDVIWRALLNAGYNFKELIDEDIKNYTEDYSYIETIDSNIDFRRVYNIHVFLEKNTISLTTDIMKIEEFQPGDILVFSNDKHIGIVSDKRNKKGIPYLIHHTGSIANQMNHLEEDILSQYKIIGHYRFQLKNR